jgi:hypothetical protein
VTAGAFEACRVELGLSVFALWLAYFTLGGLRTAQELDHYLAGDPFAPFADHDPLVHALNEAYELRGQPRRLAYRS